MKETHKVELELELIQSRNFLHQQVVVRRTLFVLLNSSSSSAFKKELSYPPTHIIQRHHCTSMHHHHFAFFLFISLNLLHLKHKQDRITIKQGNLTEFCRTLPLLINETR